MEDQNDQDPARKTPLTVEGELVKPWQLWRLKSRDGERHDRIAEADTREELWRIHKRRFDWHYAIYHNGKRVED